LPTVLLVQRRAFVALSFVTLIRVRLEGVPELNENGVVSPCPFDVCAKEAVSTAGDDTFKQSRTLGHSSVAVTENHYAHLLKDDMVAASQQVKVPVEPRGNANVLQMERRHA
jgi:hypothetical protein